MTRTNADRVIDELKSRKGFDAFWGPIDDGIRQDIKDSIEEVIE